MRARFEVWGFNIHPLTIASESFNCRQIGCESRQREGWPLPNPTGLAGVFEGHCPPHFPDMRAAVRKVAERKFGPGGPYSPDTPGPWSDTRTVRSSAQVHDERFLECVAVMAQHIYEIGGRFPARFPSVFHIMYVQAHHLELEFYDRYFHPGAYLASHKDHMALWHSDMVAAAPAG